MSADEQPLPSIEAMVIPAPTPSPVSPVGLPGQPSSDVIGDGSITVKQSTHSAEQMRINSSNSSDSSAKVCSAGPGGTDDHIRNHSGDMMPNLPIQNDEDVTLAPAQGWTWAKHLEFEALWGATELTVAEVGTFYGCSRRTVHRWRHDLGLGPRRDSQRLSPAARDCQCLRELIAQTVSPGVEGLLAVARARRAQPDRKKPGARHSQSKPVTPEQIAAFVSLWRAPYQTVDQIAKRYQVSERTIWAWTQEFGLISRHNASFSAVGNIIDSMQEVANVARAMARAAMNRPQGPGAPGAGQGPAPGV